MSERYRRPLLLMVLLLGVCLTSGCGIFRSGAHGDLSLHSERGGDIPIAGHFDTGLYSFNGQDTLTVVLVQGELDAPREAVVMRLFWRPAAGSTPVDPAATNATVRYIRFEQEAAGSSSNSTGEQAATSPTASQHVAIYSGAGFMFPNSRPGEARFRAGLWSAALRLTDASAGYEPGLGNAQLSGKFTVYRDDAGVPRVLRHLNNAITRALQYPRMVRADVNDATDVN